MFVASPPRTRPDEPRFPSRPGAGPWLIAVVLLALVTMPSWAESAEERGEAPYLVPRAEGEVVIDGAVEEAAWERALKVPLRFEVRPGENVEAPVETWVLLLYDETHLLVAFGPTIPSPRRSGRGCASAIGCGTTTSWG